MKIHGDLLVKKLTKDGFIVLWSCLTGKMLDDGPNIVQKIAESLKGIRVYGPQEQTRELKTKRGRD